MMPPTMLPTSPHNPVIQLLPGTDLSQQWEIVQAPPLPEGVPVGLYRKKLQTTKK